MHFCRSNDSLGGNTKALGSATADEKDIENLTMTLSRSCITEIRLLPNDVDPAMKSESAMYCSCAPWAEGRRQAFVSRTKGQTG